MSANLRPDSEKVKHFLSLLWSGAERGVLSLVEFAEGKVHPSFHDVRVVTRVVKVYAEQSVTADLYHTVGLLQKNPEKGRGTEADVIAIPGLWFDLDCKEGKHNVQDLPSRDEALTFLREFPLRPSLVVWSGGGLHIYWLFTKPLYFLTEEERLAGKDLSVAFQKAIILQGQDRGWKLDNTSDLIRLLRLPGTFNHKREPVMVEILEESGLRYVPADFDDLAWERPSGNNEELSGSSRILKFELDSLPLSIAVKKLIREGVSPGERSEAVMSVITSLIKAGVGDDVIIRIFEEHPEGIGQKYREKGSGREKWMRTEIHRAKAKFTGEKEGREPERFDEAKRQYPRNGFPWEVLPESVSISLKQLARSCASSPTSLPGAAVTILASVIGSTVSVSPKPSWEEPLIFWSCDIRPSGSGKTPAARSLCRVLYEMQSKADLAYREAMDVWESQEKKSRGIPPQRPRGYFVTNLTLEGLRSDHSGHGGKVCVLDELSAFISGQNEYKQKGSDRESWLCLYDGKPARIVRAKEAITLSGSRVSIFGGVQPGVWQKAFCQDDQIYLQDGTIFRFLPTYEAGGYYPLTQESWSDRQREIWESVLKAAILWSDRMHREGRSLNISLSTEAQSAFLNWRNDLVTAVEDLPVQVRGFVPKLIGYSLRWSGILFIMDSFIRGQEPSDVMDVSDIERGIKVCQFYLGHILVAMEAIQGSIPELVEQTDQVIHLAKTLKSLEVAVDNSMLAIGHIQEKFNESCDSILKVRSPRLMGSILRRCGLTVTPGKHRSNNRVGVFCMVWDKKTKSFLESCLHSPLSPQSEEG